MELYLIIVVIIIVWIYQLTKKSTENFIGNLKSTTNFHRQFYKEFSKMELEKIISDNLDEYLKYYDAAEEEYKRDNPESSLPEGYSDYWMDYRKEFTDFFDVRIAQKTGIEFIANFRGAADAYYTIEKYRLQNEDFSIEDDSDFYKTYPNYDVNSSEEDFSEVQCTKKRMEYLKKNKSVNRDIYTIMESIREGDLEKFESLISKMKTYIGVGPHLINQLGYYSETIDSVTFQKMYSLVFENLINIQEDDSDTFSDTVMWLLRIPNKQKYNFDFCEIDFEKILEKEENDNQLYLISKLVEDCYKTSNLNNTSSLAQAISESNHEHSKLLQEIMKKTKKNIISFNDTQIRKICLKNYTELLDVILQNRKYDLIELSKTKNLSKEVKMIIQKYNTKKEG